MSEPAAPHANKSSEDYAAARALRRAVQQWPMISVCGLIAAIAAFGYSTSQTKQYEASTTIQLTEVDLAAIVTGQNLQQQGQDAQAMAATNAQLIVMPEVRAATARALGGRVTVGQLSDDVRATPTNGTTLVEISARNPDPKLAAAIADATREAFIADRQQASAAQYDDASSRVTAQLAALPAAQRHTTSADALRDRLQQIQTLKAVSTGGVQTAQPAIVPTSPVAPRPKRDAILGLLIGMIVGGGVAMLRARLDDRVRDTAELGSLWDLPVVGLVPDTDGLRHSGVVLPDGPALEALSLARTNLRYLRVGTAVKTLIVTSALEGEGKSTITWNLGLAAALAKSRVLVVEADLRRPMITNRLGMSAPQGLSEILAGFATLDDALLPVTVADPSRAVSVSVDVLPAGLAPPSPVALLEQPMMAELLAELRSRYDVILIDTPPATIVADAMAFMDHVDGVLVVSRLGKLRRSALLRLREVLEGIDAPVIGQIVNSGASARAYGYTSYTKAKPSDAPPPVSPPSGRPTLDEERSDALALRAE